MLCVDEIARQVDDQWEHFFKSRFVNTLLKQDGVRNVHIYGPIAAGHISTCVSHWFITREVQPLSFGVWGLSFVT
jgi:hypothetical protein